LQENNYFTWSKHLCFQHAVSVHMPLNDNELRSLTPSS